MVRRVEQCRRLQVLAAHTTGFSWTRDESVGVRQGCSDFASRMAKVRHLHERSARSLCRGTGWDRRTLAWIHEERVFLSKSLERCLSAGIRAGAEPGDRTFDQ